MVTTEKHEVRRLTITGYGSGGEGVARLEDGRAVFVKGALAGEVCDVQLLKAGKTAVWGSVSAVVKPSPARVVPDCPYFPRCGGCQLRHMDYGEELSFKKQRVEDALLRIGGTDCPVSAVAGAETILRYRNKVQFPVAPGPKGPRIGFYRARSHDVVDIKDCLLQGEQAARLRSAVKQWMADCGAPPYDERTGEGLVRHVFVRTDGQGGSLCCLVVNGERVPREERLVALLRSAEPGLKGVLLNINRRDTNVVLGRQYRTLWGADSLEDTLAGLRFRLSVPSFFQVNRAQAEVLYEKAVELAGLTGEETVLDLYCGVGTITLAMARRAGQAIGAEIVPAAVEDARENAARNGLKNVRFLCGDAGEAARELKRQGLKADVVCIDPPRKGVTPGVIETVCALGPRRIVYLSCDPATLARDIRLFRAGGYPLQRAEVVDLFPRTHHVETVALMSREKTGGA